MAVLADDVEERLEGRCNPDEGHACFMVMNTTPHRFRFGLMAEHVTSRDELVATALRAEAAGYSTSSSAITSPTSRSAISWARSPRSPRSPL
ncbi:MAG: hypothetical protein QOG45_1685 [Chloroflexota bacterium]|nr:hypothetical protein [Chloroflexota bacterium]